MTDYKKTAKQLIETNERYAGFILLDIPKKFSELFKDQNIGYVQVLSMYHPESFSENEVLDFCGVFGWKENKLISLDGDSYNKDTTVYGFKWFSDCEIYRHSVSFTQYMAERKVM